MGKTGSTDNRWGYIVVGDKYIDLTYEYVLFLVKIGSEAGVNSQIISNKNERKK